jgi:hypothetical protein
MNYCVSKYLCLLTIVLFFFLLKVVAPSGHQWPMPLLGMLILGGSQLEARWVNSWREVFLKIIWAKWTGSCRVHAWQAVLL